MSKKIEIAGPVRRQAITWLVTALVLFVVLVTLGLLMRLSQANQLQLGPDYFYSFMTLHGLGMAGTAFMAGLAIVWALLAREINPGAGFMWVCYGLILVATTGLVAATLVGKFAAGWYVLYPLPFVKITWPEWATGLSIISLLILGTAWLLIQLHLVLAMARRYGAGNLLAWQYFSSKQPASETPPLVLITVVSLLAGIITTIAGAVLLLLYLARWLSPDLNLNALLMKNIVFLFGHTIVNITMYLGLAAVYEILPRFTGRSWPTNKIVAISWNFVLFFVLAAFLHHLYMDFAQPVGLHYLGQIASYASAVPATVVTVFGAIGQVYRSGLKWSFVPLAMYVGIVSWVIGGYAAVVDSTIAVNVIFHNTMWVPAHFHTYFLMGYMLILFATTYYIVGAQAESLARAALGIMVAGGYGFLTMFYLSGVYGVPRRFANYKAILPQSIGSAGAAFASIAVWSIIIFLAGFVLYSFCLLRKTKET